MLGVGLERGIGLLHVVMGASLVATAAVASLDPRIRRLEDELPDAIPVALPAEPNPPPAPGGPRPAMRRGAPVAALVQIELRGQLAAEGAVDVDHRQQVLRLADAPVLGEDLPARGGAAVPAEHAQQIVGPHRAGDERARDSEHVRPAPGDPSRVDPGARDPVEGAVVGAVAGAGRGRRVVSGGLAAPDAYLGYDRDTTLLAKPESV